MEFFPTRYFEVELNLESEIAMKNLKDKTLLKDFLVSEWTKKRFIGQVQNNGFRIISSKVGRGAICVLEGQFKNKQGTIEIKVHDAFKVMFSILMLMAPVAFGVAVYQNGLYNSITLIIPALMSFLFVRFAFLEVIFRIVSKNGLNHLTDIISIKTKKRLTEKQFLLLRNSLIHYSKPKWRDQR